MPDSLTPEQLDRELQQTEPDYVVYAPHRTGGGEITNTGIEHFLVFDSPDGALLALWTQSTHEGAGDQHLVLARSDDDGHSWTPPRHIVGPRFVGDGPMASWGFPLVSASGRIYAAWNQYRGVDDVNKQFTGTMDACSSDDLGVTWSHPAPLLRRDHGRPIEEPIACCPIYRLADGRYMPFMDIDTGLGPQGRLDIGVYSSFTTRHGENVLWHPDRKFFLLGKRVTDDLLDDLVVPR